MPRLYSTTTPTPAAIRAAVAQLGAEHPWRAERVAAAGQLLIRGGWKVAPEGAVCFVGGVVATHSHCTCQEAPTIECLHKIAVRELLPLSAALAAAAREPHEAREERAGGDLSWPPPYTLRACIAQTPRLTLWRWRPAGARRPAA